MPTCPECGKRPGLQSESGWCKACVERKRRAGKVGSFKDPKGMVLPTLCPLCWPTYKRLTCPESGHLTCFKHWQASPEGQVQLKQAWAINWMDVGDET